MRKLIVHGEKCKGCELCIRECPGKALYISDIENAKGAKQIAVKEESCLACGICYYMCPDAVFELKEV